MSRRSVRINDLLRDELSKLISKQLKDPRINGMLSVTEVEVSPDLKSARAYISILGEPSEKKLTLEGLVSSAGFLRRQLGTLIRIRQIPEIQFILDESIEQGNELLTLMDELKKNENEENNPVR